MSSTHLSNPVRPQEHKHLTFTEMEHVKDTSHISLNILADSDVRREPLDKPLPSTDQSSKRSLPTSPKHTSLSHTTEMPCETMQEAEALRGHDGRNEMSSSASIQPLDQSNISDNHSRRVLCNNCDEWITTEDIDGDDSLNWAEHVASCAYRSVPREVSPSVAGDVATSISATPAPTADSNEPRDTNTAFRRRKVKYYESERLALLQRDPQADEVEAYRVLCGFCDKWIPLRKDRPYCPIAWTAHKLQCVSRRRNKNGSLAKKMKREHMATSAVPAETPSPPTVQVRRTEGERLRFLESDPHATTVEPHRILCGICRRWIQLRKNSTYCTAPWVQHVKKCAVKHNTPRRINGTSTAYQLDEDGEDEVDSEDVNPQRRANIISTPTKRRRGRPRKHKVGEPAGEGLPSFPVRPVTGASTSLSKNQKGSRRSSVSPLPVRTPSPALVHPNPHDMYWYPALPPMSSYYPLYAGSQYSKNDDSYSLYFHAQPPHQSGSTSGQGRFRVKPPKQPPGNPTSAPASATWPSVPPGLSPPLGPAASPGPDGASDPSGRAWIVWRLRDYSANPCPIDHAGVLDSHTSALSEASASGSSSEPLPMYRSGTWPHLMDPEDPTLQQNLSPYVHPEMGTDNSGPHGIRPGHLNHLRPPPSRPSTEDPALITFNSSAHIPMRKSDTYATQPSAVSDSKVDARFSEPLSRPTVAVPPDPPTGLDLDSPERRLAFTFQAIAYLFSTSYQGADDMSLDTLMTFMNRTIPRDKMYDGQEVSQHVAILGERKQLVFTKEGGVQLLGSP